MCLLFRKIPIQTVNSDGFPAGIQPPAPGTRIEPGGEVPSGECPRCGALCYIYKEGTDGMEIKCQIKGCGKIADLPMKPAAVRQKAFEKAGVVTLLPPGSVMYVCSDCRGKLTKLALEIVTLLGGREVPLWQLIPEDQRGILRDEKLRHGPRR